MTNELKQACDHKGSLQLRCSTCGDTWSDPARARSFLNTWLKKYTPWVDEDKEQDGKK